MLIISQDFILTGLLQQLEEKRVNVGWHRVLSNEGGYPIHDYRPAPPLMAPLSVQSFKMFLK